MSKRTRTEKCEVDLLVAGGGAAGVPCALAAARNGARVLLCHDRPVLGGNASSEVRMHIVGANGHGALDRGSELQTEAREGGIVEEIRLENCLRNPHRSASLFDLILYDLCRRETNLTLLLNTSVVAAETEGRRVVSATAMAPSIEREYVIRAATFIDCTGDGRLAAEAGADYREGREGRDEFGEPLAPLHGDSQRLGSTLLLQARCYDTPQPFAAPPWVRHFTRHDLRHRLYAVPGGETPSLEYGFWWVEWGGHLNTIGENESIRDELAAIALGVWDHIKNGEGAAVFDAECWALEWFGFVPGKRESRRFIGRHVLTQHDLEQARDFTDAIAYGGWPLDLHPPAGIDAPDDLPCEQHPLPYLYSVPLRACIARDFDNLLFAGRNLSATHVAFSSTRVMATCGVVGQGVGTAAAISLKRGIDVAQAIDDGQAMEEIQQALLRDDAFLLGVTNNDPADRARTASITASSWAGAGEPVSVRSGATRAVHGARGARPGTAPPGIHRWVSDPEESLPAWLELRWPRPVAMREIRLVFDTGLHRHLTLTQHDKYAASMIWGRGQPETIRDYRLAVEIAGRWEPLLEVVDNYQRLRIHTIRPLEATALRITAKRTWGIDHARICEVRVYG